VLGVTRLVAFGDSFTAGFVAVSQTAIVPSPPQAYPFKLETQLRERYYDQPDIVVVNEGRNGEWAQDGQFRIVSVLGEWRPEALLLLQGANDLSAVGTRGLRLALDGLENTLRDARARGATVFLATLPPQVPGSRLGTSAGALLDEFNDGVRRLAARQTVPLVDVHAAFRGDLSLLSADGLHPNEAGYQRIAEAFFDAIRARFERPAPTT
jgi:lysophospholipase L1-like esterase